jgi:glycerate kinase
MRLALRRGMRSVDELQGERARLRAAADAPRTVLACFDGFKETLDADAVAAAVLDGVRERYGGSVRTERVSLSDGGGGFLDAMAPVWGLRRVAVPGVRGPAGAPLAAAEYGAAGDLAVVEMARAAGLHLVPEPERSPLRTSTHGAGQLLEAALRAGARRVVVGLGGSATNDAGLGALHALGLRVHLDDGRGWLPADAAVTGAMLEHVDDLEWPEDVRAALHGVAFEAACDVTNPFVGPQGAVAVYGPQKFAASTDPDSRLAASSALERGMVRIAEVLERRFGVHIADAPGAGAAGGFAGGMMAALGARLRSGVDLVAEARGLDAAIARADLVLTGEGRFDEQSMQGKVVSKVLELANVHGKPVVVVCGQTRRMPLAVYSTAARFGVDRSMADPAGCLRDLLLNDAVRLPVLDD